MRGGLDTSRVCQRVPTRGLSAAFPRASSTGLHHRTVTRDEVVPDP